ncbi:putative solute-binding protein [Alloalcanivorax xenomutans]|uniref:putative solute-binding protein n=1 Tax=Alloalcanivorax xenomutans TaxID=1094342 RepID=UPI000BC442E2|nr:putative solute-binding protein [Alloalcanivorax xenomutans]SOC07350.1 TRAP-type C4-dicarboxylate transport system substrate-binding protein [Alloalcanivorax xenomutans]
MKALLIRAATLLVLLTGIATVSAEDLRLSPEQKAKMEKLLPGVTISDSLVSELASVFYSRDMPVRVRLKAISKLVGIDQMPPGTALKRKICIWDIAGRNGPIFHAAMEQRALALEYGINLEMIPFTNESIMVDELKAGRCDAALMTGFRARDFNVYTGTIDSIGGVPDNDHMRTLLEVLAHPSQADKMVHGDYVIMGVYPGGAAHIFVNDKQISSLAKAAGKKVVVLDYDKTQAEMVAGIGATPVPSDIVSAPNKFNNGVVDILAAPLIAYELLELYKGMTPDGGIVDFPLAQISMQLVGRLDKFPNEIAQLVREASFEAYDRIRARVKIEEDRVPDRWWIHIPDKERRVYESMMQDARNVLRKQGYYDGRMLDLQKRIRCKYTPSRGECSNS